MQYLLTIENVKRTSSHMLSDIRWTVGMENELSVSGNIILEHSRPCSKRGSAFCDCTRRYGVPAAFWRCKQIREYYFVKINLNLSTHYPCPPAMFTSRGHGPWARVSKMTPVSGRRPVNTVVIFWHPCSRAVARPVTTGVIWTPVFTGRLMAHGHG